MTHPDPYKPPPRTIAAPLPSAQRQPPDYPPVAEAGMPPALELTADMLAEPPAAKRFDFERGMKMFPPLTMLLIVYLAIVFAWELSVGALENRAAIMEAGALERQAVMKGEVWRIFTAMHLHGSVDHLLGNFFGLFLMGLAVEHAFGFMPAALIYLCAGVSGAIMSLVFEGGPTVGASGAIFGWWGAAVVFLYRFRRKLLMRDARVAFVLLAWAGWTILLGFLSVEVSNFSHLGGFIAGAALAMLLPTRLVELQPATSDDDA